MPGEKFAAIGRSYRQAAFTFPTLGAGGNSFWRRWVAEGKDLNLEKRQRSPQSFPKESSLRKHIPRGIPPSVGLYSNKGIPRQQRSEDQIRPEAAFHPQ
jgi:hypothetical protein